MKTEAQVKALVASAFRAGHAQARERAAEEVERVASIMGGVTKKRWCRQCAATIREFEPEREP